MISFIYCDDQGAISIKLGDDRLLDRIERDIVGEIKLAATDEKLERAGDLITLALDFYEAMSERRKILAQKEEE